MYSAGTAATASPHARATSAVTGPMHTIGVRVQDGGIAAVGTHGVDEAAHGGAARKGEDIHPAGQLLPGLFVGRAGYGVVDWHVVDQRPTVAQQIRQIRPAGGGAWEQDADAGHVAQRQGDLLADRLGGHEIDRQPLAAQVRRPS